MRLMRLMKDFHFISIEYFRTWLYGSTVNIAVDNDINMQYNTIPRHARPMAKNAATNILYKTLLPDEENNDIVTSFHPVVIEDNVSICYLNTAITVQI